MPEKAATQMGAILGTAAYMAPEQATGLVDEIDARADVYSVGATMFRLLAGRPIHGVINDATELVRAATQPAPPLASIAYGVPPEVAAVVDRALASSSTTVPDAATCATTCARCAPACAAVRSRRERPHPPRGGARPRGAAAMQARRRSAFRA